MDQAQTAYFSFSTSKWLAAASVVAVIAGICLSYFIAKRSQWRSDVVALEVLRLIVVAAIAILLNQPEWTTEFRPTERPRLVVLVDQSKSMETRDAVIATSHGNTAVSRLEASRPILDEETWKGLTEKFDVQIEPFPKDGNATSGSDLGAALDSAIETKSRTLAVVLASDGDWNRGSAPVESAIRYRSQGIPIFTIPIGSPSRLPDLEVLSLDLPTFAIVGKSVRIPFTIESSLPRDHVATVSVKASDGETLTKEVRIAAMGKTTESVVWLPKNAGDFTVSLQLPQHPDEILATNNSLSAPIAIREEKLQVLVIDSFPRWEYRYLRNALSRDPGVDVTCLLFHPSLGRPGGGNKDYVKEFPGKLEDLARFDVVFLGDVGIESGQLTEEQCKLLKGLVEFQASGLVFLPGPQGYQQSLIGTELDALIPVVVDTANPNGQGDKSPMHFDLTESGRRSLLTKLADTEEENLDVWSTLPGFQWHAPVIRAKAGTETLSVHQETSNEYGRLPLIITKTFGAGKVLYMATDGAWRWRRGVEDKYHYRFWGQVVRWMAYQRNMAKGESVRFFFTPEQPNVGQTLSMKANVMTIHGEPLSSGDVTVKLESPSGKVDIVKLQSAGPDSWGLFEGRSVAAEPGMHQVTVHCKETGAKLNASIFVQGTGQERIGLAARPKVLEEISKVSRGDTIPLDKLSRITDLVKKTPDPPSFVKRWQLWAHPWTIGIMATLLTVFWAARKWIGLM